VYQARAAGGLPGLAEDEAGTAGS